MPSPITSAEPPGEPPGEAPNTPGPARLPELEFVPVPAGWPPYDCEVHGAGCSSTPDGAVWPAALAVREDEGDEAGWAAGPGWDGGAQQEGDRQPGAGMGASPVAAGETTAWPRQFGQVIVEVLAGRRASRQLMAWTTDNARAQVEVLVRDLASLHPPQIQRIITSRPAARVVEMTMVVRFGPRSRALALRFEHAPGRRAAPGLPARQARWLCTDIETG
jgi:hypothetical protein